MKTNIFSYALFLSLLFMSQIYAIALVKSYFNMDFNGEIFYQNFTFVLFWGALFAISLLAIIYEGVSEWKK